MIRMSNNGVFNVSVCIIGILILIIHVANILVKADDGVGFSINDVDFDANKHFGLKNIQYRLAKMCGADLAVKSEIGVGTTVTVKFPKENAK